jgi:hypothetical protein
MGRDVRIWSYVQWAVAVFCFALLPGVALGQSNAVHKGEAGAHESGNARPLVLKLSCEVREVGLGDPITVIVQIMNASSEPVRLFGELKWGYGGGLTLNVHDVKGQVVQPEQYDDDMIVPSRIPLPDAYIVLPPDHIFGVARPDLAKNLFGKPGHYRLSVRYWSPVAQSQARRTKFFGRESGPIDSNTIDVTVR